MGFKVGDDEPQFHRYSTERLAAAYSVLMFEYTRAIENQNEIDAQPQAREARYLRSALHVTGERNPRYVFSTRFRIFKLEKQARQSVLGDQTTAVGKRSGRARADVDFHRHPDSVRHDVVAAAAVLSQRVGFELDALPSDESLADLRKHTAHLVARGLAHPSPPFGL